MARVVVVGSINTDLWVGVARHPMPGETVPGWGGNFTPGGKGANQTAAAALLGADVAMVGAVGDDPNADPALSVLERCGADLTHVRRIPGPTGVAIVVVAENGENNIIVIPGANAHVTSEAVEEARDLVEGAEIVVLQGEIPSEGLEAAARMATGRLLLNLAPVVPVSSDVVRRADPLVVNEHEGRLVLRDLTREDEGLGERDTVAALLAAGVRSVVMTLGARGALVTTDGTIREVPSPRIEPVDSTGAGDAFVGALAFRLSQGDDLLAAARHAARVGAFACTRAGAQASYPEAGDELPAL